MTRLKKLSMDMVTTLPGPSSFKETWLLIDNENPQGIQYGPSIKRTWFDNSEDFKTMEWISRDI